MQTMILNMASNL